MKNSFIFGIILVLSVSNMKIYAKQYKHVRFKQTDNEFIFDFSLPEFCFDSVDVYNSKFSGERFVNIRMEEGFGITDSIGCPELPFYSILVAFPNDADKPCIRIVDEKINEIKLKNKIYPFQNPQRDKVDQSDVFDFNELHYSSDNEIYSTIKVTDDFIMAGIRGLRITVFPFRYNPKAGKLEVIKKLKFSIPIKENTIYSGSNSYVYQTLYKHIFINGVSRQKSVSSDNYLIITAPDYYSEIQSFANFKRNIGYNVTVVSTSTTGTTNTAIRNYIVSQYNNTASRPVFLLLVGDTDKIPHWDGTHIEQPCTDLFYSTVDGNDETPDLFIGRFSVRSPQELHNIINKTIYMETNIHSINKNALFIADSDNYLSTEPALNSVIDNAFQPNGYTCTKLYARFNATSNDITDELNNGQIFMLYSGHGNIGYLFNPYYDNRYLSSLSSQINPFTFAFACKTNQYKAQTCFGESWIQDDKAGVCYYGASINSIYHVDGPFIKEMFIEVWNDEGINQLGALVQTGMVYLCNNILSFGFRLRYKEMYNLLGDPSIFTNGIGCISNYYLDNNEVFNQYDKITYHADNSVFAAHNSGSFVLNSGANIFLKAGHNLKI